MLSPDCDQEKKFQVLKRGMGVAEEHCLGNRNGRSLGKRPFSVWVLRLPNSGLGIGRLPGSNLPPQRECQGVKAASLRPPEQRFASLRSPTGRASDRIMDGTLEVF